MSKHNKARKLRGSQLGFLTFRGKVPVENAPSSFQVPLSLEHSTLNSQLVFLSAKKKEKRVEEVLLMKQEMRVKSPKSGVSRTRKSKANQIKFYKHKTSLYIKILRSSNDMA